ncbi:MAG: 3-dehydroquinate synthase [Puniceicoccaceae bacterium]
MPADSLTVSLGNRSYPIHVGRDLAALIAGQVSKDKSEGRKVAVITDVSVAKAQADFMQAAFEDTPVLALPSGESTKSFQQLEKCCDFLAESGLDRTGRVFAVGGGVIGDLAGYAAASFFRGVGFYQVPTTLLAMVDSSVGGKTGINLECGKNLVGAFHQPLAVYADLDTLKSLPAREFSAGMAEVIKHGLLADAELFADLEQLDRLTPESPEMGPIVRRNCSIKAGVVSADEKEQSKSGGRALLNLGHTFGHAIEAVAGYGHYLHGEAIAIGLVLACQFSVELGLVDASVPEKATVLIRKYDLPVELAEPLALEGLLAAARKDKKARAGKLRYVALERIGKAITVEDVDEQQVVPLWKGVGAE